MFFCRIFVVSSTEKLPWGTLLCCVSENSVREKFIGYAGKGVGDGRSITIFCRNVCVSQY